MAYLIAKASSLIPSLHSCHFKKRFSQKARQHSICRSETLERSPDNSDDDLDSALSIELRLKSDPDYLLKAAKRLDVVFSVSSKRVRLPFGHEFVVSAAHRVFGKISILHSRREISRTSVLAAVELEEDVALFAEVVIFCTFLSRCALHAVLRLAGACP